MQPKLKGKFVTSSKVKFFKIRSVKKKLEIINKNYHKKYFLAIMMN